MAHKVLYSEDEIHAVVGKMAAVIASDFAGKDIVLVAVLKGAFMFLADIAREIEWLSEGDKGVNSCLIEFMSVSSYGDATKPGDIKIELDLRRSIRDRHVILIEDVADTLQTLGRVQQHLLDKEPASLHTAVLLTKPHNHQREDIKLDYIGIVGEGVGFVYGYGMDVAGKWRALRFIAQMES